MCKNKNNQQQPQTDYILWTKEEDKTYMARALEYSEAQAILCNSVKNSFILEAPSGGIICVTKISDNASGIPHQNNPLATETEDCLNGLSVCLYEGYVTNVAIPNNDQNIALGIERKLSNHFKLGCSAVRNQSMCIITPLYLRCPEAKRLEGITDFLQHNKITATEALIQGLDNIRERRLQEEEQAQAEERLQEEILVLIQEELRLIEGQLGQTEETPAPIQQRLSRISRERRQAEEQARTEEGQQEEILVLIQEELRRIEGQLGLMEEIPAPIQQRLSRIGRELQQGEKRASIHRQRQEEIQARIYEKLTLIAQQLGEAEEPPDLIHEELYNIDRALRQEEIQAQRRKKQLKEIRSLIHKLQQEEKQTLTQEELMRSDQELGQRPGPACCDSGNKKISHADISAAIETFSSTNTLEEKIEQALEERASSLRDILMLWDIDYRDEFRWVHDLVLGNISNLKMLIAMSKHTSVIPALMSNIMKDLQSLLQVFKELESSGPTSCQNTCPLQVAVADPLCGTELLPACSSSDVPDTSSSSSSGGAIQPHSILAMALHHAVMRNRDAKEIISFVDTLLEKSGLGKLIDRHDLDLLESIWTPWVETYNSQLSIGFCNIQQGHLEEIGQCFLGSPSSDHGFRLLKLYQSTIVTQLKLFRSTLQSEIIQQPPKALCQYHMASTTPAPLIGRCVCGILGGGSVLAAAAAAAGSIVIVSLPALMILPFAVVATLLGCLAGGMLESWVRGHSTINLTQGTAFGFVSVPLFIIVGMALTGTGLAVPALAACSAVGFVGGVLERVSREEWGEIEPTEQQAELEGCWKVNINFFERERDTAAVETWVGWFDTNAVGNIINGSITYTRIQELGTIQTGEHTNIQGWIHTTLAARTSGTASKIILPSGYSVNLNTNCKIGVKASFIEGSDSHRRWFRGLLVNSFIESYLQFEEEHKILRVNTNTNLFDAKEINALRTMAKALGWDFMTDLGRVERVDSDSATAPSIGPRLITAPSQNLVQRQSTQNQAQENRDE